jgi:PIN domain nuclease of toxin-antitoxin system
MNLLLDTHTFIWWDDNNQRLSSAAQDALTDPDHTVYLSLVSIWEMQIKVQLGRLDFNLSIAQKVAGQRQQNGLLILPLREAHIYALSELADHHRDPFDRLLIAQARHEGLTLVTADANVRAYDVQTLW